MRQNRTVLRRRRNEVLTTGGVIAAVVMVLIGLGVLGLCGTLLVQMISDGVGPFGTVGIARPTPAWIAIIGLCVGILGGLDLVVDNSGYLIRCARGMVPRPANDKRARREHASRKASRHQRQVGARSAEAQRRDPRA